MIFFRPVSRAFRITQNFGEDPKRYPRTNGHPGIDYGATTGSKVRAAASGTVIMAAMDPETERTPTAGYGIEVRILHPHNVLTIYAHLLDPLVQVGQVVKVGEPIGISNNTGNSDGPHVHFEVRTGLMLLNAIDPAPFMTDTIPNESVLYSVVVTPAGNSLRAHKGPAVEKGVNKNFKTGETIQVFDEVENGTWLRVEDGFIMNNPDFIQKVPGSEAETTRPGSKQPAEFHTEPVLFTVKITPKGNALNVRRAPDPKSEVFFALIRGQTADVLEVVEDGAWLRIEEGFILNNPKWVRKIGTPDEEAAEDNPKPPLQAPLGPALFSVRVTPLGNNLHVRDEPSLEDGEVLLSLRSGQVVAVFEEVQDHAWLRVQDGFIVNNPDWVEKLAAPLSADDAAEPALTLEVPDEPALFSVRVTPAGRGLRVRSGPSLTSDVISGLISGQEVEVFEEQIEDGWLRIRTGFIKENPDWLVRV